MRVALIHYWLINTRGGEKTLKAIGELYPGADIYTHVVDPAVAARDFPGHKVSTTFIGRLPFAKTLYQKYLPLMPYALEQLDLRQYDLVISSESGPAKGVIVAPHTTHVCYCHSPMRYVWDLYPEYRQHVGALARFAMIPLLQSVADVGSAFCAAGRRLRGQFAVRRLADCQVLPAQCRRNLPARGHRSVLGVGRERGLLFVRGAARCLQKG